MPLSLSLSLSIIIFRFLLFFFHHDQHQPVSFFAKEKIRFLSDCQHDTLSKGFFFLTFLSWFACLYAGSFGKSDDYQPFRTLLVDYFQGTLQFS